MKTNNDLYYELRYKAYEGALNILKSNYTSIQERKAAISVKEEFESDMKNGRFREIFLGVELECKNEIKK